MNQLKNNADREIVVRAFWKALHSPHWKFCGGWSFWSIDGRQPWPFKWRIQSAFIPRIYSSFIVKAARNLPSAARYFDRYEWIFRGLPRPRIGPLLTSAQWGRRGGDRNALRVTDKSYAIRATGCYRQRDDDRATDLFSRNFAGNLYGGETFIVEYLGWR